jgi:Domain of unknown function (DUF4395)
VNVRMVDPRQPRLGQAITGVVLLGGFVLDWPPVLPAVGAILAAASLLGPKANLYGHLFRAAKRGLRLGPPRELEESGPPRFANTLGFIVLAVATAAHYAFGASALAWSLGLLVSALALLSAITGLCVGCELYVIGRRLVTRGRIAHRRTAPPPVEVRT